MGPLYKFGWFDYMYSLQLAGLIGFFFGFLLERAGFGNPKKLVSVFYLRDFAVFKVMFTAIVVCILGLLYFSVFGWIDLGRVYLLPTFLWPQIAGGVLLGVGFVMGGYCPTTSVVAAVSGKVDGMIFLVGMVFGSFVFAELFPLLQGFYRSGNWGAVKLPDILGISSGSFAAALSVGAVAAFWLVERVERRFGDPAVLPLPSVRGKTFAALPAVILGLTLAVIPMGADRRPSGQKEPTKKAAPVEDSPRKGEQPGFRIIQDEGC